MDTVAEPAATRREPPPAADGPARDEGRSSRAPLLALTGIVLGAFALYSVLALAVDVPRVHPDELRYLVAGSSLVEGEGLTMRGGEYGLGPLLPALLALLLWIAGSADAAYDWFKAANALFFAATAIPAYLLARRLVAAWWAVLAALLTVAIPSSISAGTVMTESLSFFAVMWGMYAIALALERPSVLRQLAVLGATAAAFLVKPQFAILWLTWVGALALVWAVVPGSRPRSRNEWARLWPSALPLVLGVVALGARLASGASAEDTLGAYRDLWRGYDPLQVAKWFVYHLADFEIYLAVVPFAVAPIVLWELARAGRAGDRRAASFVGLFVSANVFGLLVGAAFTSTPYGYDRLHDRYVFYLFPLWLIGFAVWLQRGLPRPLVALALGVATALALPVVLPFRQLANEAGIDTVPGALWVRIESELAGPGPASGRLALLLFVVALLAASVLLSPRSGRIALPAAVVVVFAATAFFAWERLIDAPEDRVFAGGLERDWIDARVGDDVRVTKLYVESDACPASAVTRHALFLTEFFNTSVDRAAYIGDSVPDGIPLPRVDVAPGGVLELAPGRALEAEYVFTQPGIELAGERVAEGTAAGLVLWRVGGPVRVVGATSNDDVRTRDCA